ncbi:tRNA pseudouridine synthase A, mitochondrial [Porphyridium purpureum]|uniref:tRNA pseudouridine synthase A, mitochondrial n=1 Tax=Porphyridium purpureum TaxID=35688 RepID=A0A5J4YYZ2_PORPP|nr:tRNA pseudouridine synthase A, mitochondrial [Porphyridium purpureum]|eukprot:POR8630..scf209_3
MVKPVSASAKVWAARGQQVSECESCVSRGMMRGWMPAWTGAVAPRWSHVTGGRAHASTCRYITGLSRARANVTRARPRAWCRMCSGASTDTLESVGLENKPLLQDEQNQEANELQQDHQRRSTVKRRVALYLGFDGRDYNGFQRQKNQDVRTIEEEIRKALVLAKLVSDHNADDLNKTKWSCAARTDRGVSAAAQIATLKIEWPRDDEFDDEILCERLRPFLPPEIVLYGAQRTVASFNARLACAYRRYEYVLPLSVLQMWQPKSRIQDVETMVRRLNELLSHYVGTNSYHNFTRMGKVDAGLDRYIVSIACMEQPLTIPSTGKQFLRVRVVGQSFILHQIRKMVGLAVLALMGIVRDTEIARALTQCRPGSGELPILVPPAPAEGLLLDDLEYTFWNERFYPDKGMDAPISFEPYDTKREQFKSQVLYANLDFDDAMHQFLSRGVLHASRPDGEVAPAWQSAFASADSGHRLEGSWFMLGDMPPVGVRMVEEDIEAARRMDQGAAARADASNHETSSE